MPTFKIKMYRGKSISEDVHPIILQVIHQRKTRRISLGFKAHINEWILDLQRYSSKAKNYKNKNQLLDHFEEKAETVYNQILKEGKKFEFTLFASRFKDSTENKSLFQVYTEILDELKAAKRYSTKNVFSASKKTQYLIKKASFLRLAKLMNWEFTFVNDQF